MSTPEPETKEFFENKILSKLGTEDIKRAVTALYCLFETLYTGFNLETRNYEINENTNIDTINDGVLFLFFIQTYERNKTTTGFKDYYYKFATNLLERPKFILDFLWKLKELIKTSPLMEKMEPLFTALEKIIKIGEEQRDEDSHIYRQEREKLNSLIDFLTQ